MGASEWGMEQVRMASRDSCENWPCIPFHHTSRSMSQATTTAALGLSGIRQHQGARHSPPVQSPLVSSISKVQFRKCISQRRTEDKNNDVQQLLASCGIFVTMTAI